MLKALPEFKKEVEQNAGTRATIFAYYVPDPERFGVVEFDREFRAVSIEGKPKKSNYAFVGLYFYPRNVVGKIEQQVPSIRCELEIIDLNNIYLKEGQVSMVPMWRGNFWLDAEIPVSLMEASFFRPDRIASGTENSLY